MRKQPSRIIWMRKAFFNAKPDGRSSLFGVCKQWVLTFNRKSSWDPKQASKKQATVSEKQQIFKNYLHQSIQQLEAGSCHCVQNKSHTTWYLPNTTSSEIDEVYNTTGCFPGEENNELFEVLRTGLVFRFVLAKRHP